MSFAVQDIHVWVLLSVGYMLEANYWCNDLQQM